MTTTSTEPAECRRCGRSLRSAAARALGLGSTCAGHLQPSVLETLADAAGAATRQLHLAFTDDDPGQAGS